MPRSEPSAKPPPFQVATEPSRHLVRATFRGVVRPTDMRKQVDHMKVQLGELGHGFTMLTDLADLEHMDLECVGELTRMMDVCMAAGIGKVVRVIPDPNKDIGFNLLSLTHYRGKVPTATCETREEAEAELAH